MPVFPFLTSDSTVYVAVMIAALVLVAGGLLLARQRWRVGASDILVGLAVVGALFHNGVIAVVGTGLAVVRAKERPLSTVTRVGLLTVLVLMAGWVILVLGRSDIAFREIGRDSLLGALRLMFLGWPDFYTPLILPWSRDLPLLGLLIAIAVAYQLVRLARGSLADAVVHPAFFIAYICVAIGVLTAPYVSTRYTFFIYPIGLFVLASTALDAVRWARWVLRYACSSR